MESSTQRSNRLIKEKSPYLLQHAHNPVDWYPWGEEAFQIARQQNKPIFLSIGYFSCHWCHVLEKESFENETTAQIMNENFVCVKVDREERPDIDNFYMTFVQATTGGGGWPLSVWLTPELKPFLGGTYFPPEDTASSPGFPTVLSVISEKWQRERDRLLTSADNVVDAIRRFSQAKVDKSNNIDPELPVQCLHDLRSSFDEKHPGFTWSPKFPTVSILNFLSRFHSLESVKDKVNVKELPLAGLKSHLASLQISFPEESDHKTLIGCYDEYMIKREKNALLALEMLTRTLNSMAKGGIHDHVSQGFHRYSVDREWHVPHFEKMLYDQAQLAVIYSEAYQITKNKYFAEIAEDILTYVCRDLSDSLGGFYCAEDADSKETESSTEAKEGAFCVWTQDEMNQILQEDSKLFSYHFGVNETGNVPSSTDIQGELKGKNVLIQRHEVSETASTFSIEEKDCIQKLDLCKKKLFEARSKRPKPNLDDKVVVSWNGMMITALSKTYQILNKTEYLERATKAANFIWDQLYNKDTNTLMRCYRHGPSDIEGFLDDYAFLIQALIDLYESDFNSKWLDWAVDLQSKQDELFFDQENGGYFGSSSNDKTILIRLKEATDNAEPSSNSISALNLLRLSSLTGNMELKEKSMSCILSFQKNLAQNSTSLCFMTSVFHMYQSSIKQIVVVGDKKNEETKELIKKIRSTYTPNKVLILTEEGKHRKVFENNVAVKESRQISNKPTVYVCHNFVCNRPVTDPYQIEI